MKQNYKIYPEFIKQYNNVLVRIILEINGIQICVLTKVFPLNSNEDFKTWAEDFVKNFELVKN